MISKAPSDPQPIQNTFIPWCKIEKDKLILQEDGATCHRSRFTQAFKRDNDIKVLEQWPSLRTFGQFSIGKLNPEEGQMILNKELFNS
jgi:hypothetical protein